MKKNVISGSRIDERSYVLISKSAPSLTPEQAYAALSSCEWDASGAVVCGDIVIASTVSVKGLTVIGSLTIESDAVGTTLSECRIEGYIDNRADRFSLLRSAVIYSGEGLCDSSQSALFVRDCVFCGAGTSISSYAEDAQITFCTVEGAIVLGNAQNQMAALNIADAISISGSRNAVILKNRAESITADSCHAIYVIENEVSGTLTLTEDNFLIADLNRAGNIESGGNENVNGDTLVDVNARLEVGADQELLPHTDKDLFVEMPRKAFVYDPDAASCLTLPQYIMEYSAEDDIVIVAPGAYCSDECIKFDGTHANATIYAYGVYAERQEDLYPHIHISHTESILIKGLTLAFRQQSCGQVYVLELLGMEEGGKSAMMRVVTGAGMMDEFCNSNPRYYNTLGIGAQRAGTFYAYCDTRILEIFPTEPDGTRLIRVPDFDYDNYRVGDILTCRGSNGGGTIYVGYSANVTFYDFTMFGNAAAFAWTESNNTTATTYYRVANTTRSSEVIDEETYRRYRDYEKKYGISLEIYEDELGRFRGSPCHIGSIDATHTMRCGQGSVAICCLFEHMCDDGTNQNHTHARLADIVDNGDGTSTVFYKGMHPMFFYNCRGREKCREHICDGYCSDFKTGHRVYIYTSGGQLVCDTPALSETVSEGKRIAQEYGTEYELKSVRIATDAVNHKALIGYDLTKNTPEDGPGEKVMVDNMSLASNGFLFDNTVVRGTRSRGLLVKASGGKIINCTFEHVGMSCVAILYEIYWGESGVTENMEVRNNLFDHTGYFALRDYRYTNVDRYAPISIEGLGSSVDEDYLLYKNIHFEGNVIKNRTTKYAVYVNSAKDISLINNDFGSVNEIGNHFTSDVFINGAMNIELSGNTYSYKDAAREDSVKVAHIKNVFGSDVTRDGKPIFEDQE